MPTTDKEPIVTVIMPCHNHATYVANAISSVVAQDYPNKRLIVVNDGSKDNSGEVIYRMFDEVGTKDGVVFGRINGVESYLMTNEQAQGPSAARNKAIQAAINKTDYFSMIDADDAYYQGKITKSVEKAKEHPEVIGIVYTDAIIFNQLTGNALREFREPYSRSRLEQECIISNTPLISAFAIQKMGAYDADMRTAEDWDLWLRITSKFIAVHIPEALHMYRVTGHNASDIVSQEIWQKNWRKIQERLHGRSY